MDYYKKFYTPNNITTVVVGDLNPEEIIPQIASEFDFKGRVNSLQKEFLPDTQPVGGKYIEQYSKINTGFLMFGYLGAKAVDVRTSMILEMICSILGDGISSRLYQELIEKLPEQVFNGVSSYYYSFKDGGNIFIQANFKPEAKETVILKLKEQIKKFYTEGISEKELKKVKKRIKADFASASETVSDIADTIGDFMTVYGDLKYIEDYINTIDTITAEEIKMTAQKYINVENAVISILMPEEYRNKG